MPVAAEAEQDHALLAGLLGRLRLLDHRADRMRRLGRRDDALGPGELQPAANVSSGGSARLDEPFVHERADERRVAVVAQAAGVHRRRHEVVAERVHRHQRRQPGRVAEVVGVDALGQGRAGRRLGGDEARRRAVAQVAPQPRERRGRRSSSRRRRRRSTTSGSSPAISICAIVSCPITVWCSSTWLSTRAERVVRCPRSARRPRRPRRSRCPASRSACAALRARTR